MATCVLSGKIQDLSAGGIPNIIVTAHLLTPYFNTTIMVVQYDGLNANTTNTTSTTTASDGTWSLTLQQGASTQILFDYPTGPTGGLIRKSYSVLIPLASTANFSDLALET